MLSASSLDATYQVGFGWLWKRKQDQALPIRPEPNRADPYQTTWWKRGLSTSNLFPFVLTSKGKFIRRQHDELHSLTSYLAFDYCGLDLSVCHSVMVDSSAVIKSIISALPLN